MTSVALSSCASKDNASKIDEVALKFEHRFHVPVHLGPPPARHSCGTLCSHPHFPPYPVACRQGLGRAVRRTCIHPQLFASNRVPSLSPAHLYQAQGPAHSAPRGNYSPTLHKAAPTHACRSSVDVSTRPEISHRARATRPLHAPCVALCRPGCSPTSCPFMGLLLAGLAFARACRRPTSSTVTRLDHAGVAASASPMTDLRSSS